MNRKFCDRELGQRIGLCDSSATVFAMKSETYITARIDNTIKSKELESGRSAAW
jgi:hypothetical protein